MKPAFGCLSVFKAQCISSGDKGSSSNRPISKPDSSDGDSSPHCPFSPIVGEGREKVCTVSERSEAVKHQAVRKSHDVFQVKQGVYADHPAEKMSKMMKSNSFDNAPTQSLLSVVNGILDESAVKMNGEIPYRVACLLRKVVQEIERRISIQAEHLRKQNNHFKAREDAYQSRIRMLEAVPSGSNEESRAAVCQLHQIKTEKHRGEERRNIEQEDTVKSVDEKNKQYAGISELKHELETAKEAYEVRVQQMITDTKHANEGLEPEEMAKFMKEKDQHNREILALKQELEAAQKVYEIRSMQMETDNKAAKEIFEERIKDLETTLVYWQNKVREIEKNSVLEDQNLEQKDMVRVMDEKVHFNLEISALKQELETAKKAYECSVQMETETKAAKEGLEERLKDLEHSLQMETEAKVAKAGLDQKDMAKLMKEKNQYDTEISELKLELETAKQTHKKHTVQMETEAKVAKDGLNERIKDLESTLVDWESKVKELEEISESKDQDWDQKENTFWGFVDLQFQALQELRFCSDSIKQEVLTAQKSYAEESNRLGKELVALGQAAENYHTVLAENRKLFNELQELKGNIRVYCRVRPGQTGKRSAIEHIGDNGEIVVANPSKTGKEGQRTFKFNKVFGPASTQAEVFSDTQPLIRSVLDGYSVCIFAYGQTGSGKTHTMMGPTGATEEEWGVNYRALHDLFKISQSRTGTIMYEIGVQMVEIYNEQVRDLLSQDSSQKRLGIKSTAQPNGLAVPDASMQPVTSTSDVIKLMETGLNNRAMSSTAMNERSSRSHSVVTVHVRGKDLKAGTALHGNLHLVDLAGSERVDRSEVTGDRLKEAQHINKSLAALGDVIFALAQKSSHIPYRNSKLTQLLQSSLGGQAKTLMFVQLNPDITSHSETSSTLKFAERVSGVELGAARSTKEDRDVRDLMEQVASLKDMIGKKDEEIERLQLLKDLKSVYPSVNEKLGAGSLKYESSSSSKDSANVLPPRIPDSSSPNGSIGLTEKAATGSDRTASDLDYGNKRSKLDSQQSSNDLEDQNAEIEERLSDESDSGQSPGTVLDGLAEHSLSPERKKLAENLNKTKPSSRIIRPLQKPGPTTAKVSAPKDSTRVSPSIKRTPSSSSLLKPLKR